VKLKAWKPMNTGNKGLEYKIHNPEVTGSNPVLLLKKTLKQQWGFNENNSSLSEEVK
jgi:hypothetical protein